VMAVASLRSSLLLGKLWRSPEASRFLFIHLKLISCILLLIVFRMMSSRLNGSILV
jgi:hypothetical protein